MSVAEKVSAPDYYQEIKTISEAKYTCPLYAYDGEAPVPFWFDENREKLRLVCNIKADLTEQCTPQSKIIIDDVELWELSFSVELTLGSTEIEARIKWDHNGETKYSDAQVAYI